MIGEGYIDNVQASAWDYTVSGKQVIARWFSYRRRERERPLIGDRHPPSLLGNIQPTHWLAEYTTELINLINVLTALSDLESDQLRLLNKVTSGSLFTVAELSAAGAFDIKDSAVRVSPLIDDRNLSLFG
jgi:hypothetical protein